MSASSSSAVVTSITTIITTFMLISPFVSAKVDASLNSSSNILMVKPTTAKLNSNTEEDLVVNFTLGHVNSKQVDYHDDANGAESTSFSSNNSPVAISPFSGEAAAPAAVALGAKDASHGSCFIKLNTTGNLYLNCLNKINSDGSITDITRDPEKVSTQDIGMYCAVWIKAAICMINATCEKCPNEGAIAEYFIKSAARALYYRKCHNSAVNTTVTFAPLEGVLCDVTPASKTGLIIAVVVLALCVLGQCAVICFFVPIGGKKAGEKSADKSTSSKQAKQPAAAAATSGTGTAARAGGGGGGGGSKAKPSKAK